MYNQDDSGKNFNYISIKNFKNIVNLWMVQFSAAVKPKNILLEPEKRRPPIS